MHTDLDPCPPPSGSVVAAQVALVALIMGIAVTTAYWCGAIYIGSLSAFVTVEVTEYAFNTSLFDLWVGPNA